MTYETWDELRDAVATPGLLAVELQDLRDLLGVKRLGRTVLVDIADRLLEHELDFLPDWVLLDNEEPRQNQRVWLVPKDEANAVYRVLAAIREPGEVGVDALTALLQSDGGWAEVKELTERLSRVRDALADAMSFIGDDDERARETAKRRTLGRGRTN